jgi:MacB-like periplasmic core domain
METFAAELRHAFRTLRKSPGFTATAVAALALGIGANTAIFSVVNTVLLKPLPYPDADRLVVLMSTTPQGNYPNASPTKYNVWRRQTHAFEDMTAYDTGGPGLNMSGGDRPEQIKGIHVSARTRRLAVPSPRRKTGRAAAMSQCYRTGFGGAVSDQTPRSWVGPSLSAANRSPSSACSMVTSHSIRSRMFICRFKPIPTVRIKATIFRLPRGLERG